jgi:hypothetical protein
MTEVFVTIQASLVELGKQLLAAARDGDTEGVRGLMARGAPFTADWLGTSPLHLTAQYGNYSTCEVEELILYRRPFGSVCFFCS